MKFCPACSQVMTRDPSSGAVLYRCLFCGEVEEGAPMDARIKGGTLNGGGDSIEMYQNIILSAPFDRVNQVVLRDCPECGLDTMAHVRVSADEVVIYRCTCGYQVRGDEAPLDAPLEAPLDAADAADSTAEA